MVRLEASTWVHDGGRRRLTGIILTQRAVTSPEPTEVFVDFWRYAYAAIAG